MPIVRNRTIRLDRCAVQERRGSPGGHFGVARIEALHGRPLLGRFAPLFLAIEELGQLHAPTEKLRLVGQKTNSFSLSFMRLKKHLIQTKNK